MAEPAHEGDGRTANPEVRYEPKDVRLRAVLIVLGAALVSAVVIHVAVWLYFSGYRAHQDRVKASTFPLADVPAESLPKEPRLEQIDRLSDAERMPPPQEAAEVYGETGERGYVRVPVERAMDHLAGKLPSRKEPDAEAQRRAGGLIAAGESNSGRAFRKGRR